MQSSALIVLEGNTRMGLPQMLALNAHRENIGTSLPTRHKTAFHVTVAPLEHIALCPVRQHALRALQALIRTKSAKWRVTAALQATSQLRTPQIARRAPPAFSRKQTALPSVHSAKWGCSKTQAGSVTA
jgi:hypothetical protein